MLGFVTQTPLHSSRASRLRGFPPLCELAWETRPREWLPNLQFLLHRFSCVVPRSLPKQVISEIKADGYII
jgi:hypothetical protein